MLIAHATDLFARYGGIAVFVSTFLEGESLLIAAGILTQRGLLSPWVVWLAASLGAWCGHLLWFAVGRRLRATALVRRWPAFGRRVAQANRVVRAHPKAAIFLLQYLYGLRLVGAAGLGFTSLAFERFALYEAFNCLLWAALFTAVGLALGEAAAVLFAGWLRWIWLAASVLVLMVVLHRASASAAARLGDPGNDRGGR
jgi:membrane-associated protein